jgi:hypothetical protein
VQLSLIDCCTVSPAENMQDDRASKQAVLKVGVRLNAREASELCLMCTCRAA